MNKQEQETTETKKESSIELHSVRIPYWLTEKATTELSSWEQFVVYCWIYDHNGFAIRKGGNIYGKPTYNIYHNEITRDLNITNVRKVIDKLKKAQWIAEAHSSFKGQPTKGYRCLLDSKQRVEVKEEQQELQKADEETETVIESSKPAPDADNLKEIYSWGGQYWYLDDNGEKVIIPKKAAEDVFRLRIPPHWVYDFEANPNRWCAPEDVTVRPLEF